MIFRPKSPVKPALIKPRVDPTAAPAEIDRQVSELVARGESIYAVDADLLASLAPDLIVTQDLCHVCAASPDDLATALSRFSRPPRVLTLSPHSLDDVWQDIIRTGEATNTRERAEALAAELKARVQAVASITAPPDGRSEARPRVACLEWLDPLYVGGHWVPEMVAIAGGEDVLGRAGHPSFKVSAEDVAQSNADIILVMLCGYNAKRNAQEFNAAKIPQAGKISQPFAIAASSQWTPIATSRAQARASQTASNFSRTSSIRKDLQTAPPAAVTSVYGALNAPSGAILGGWRRYKRDFSPISPCPIKQQPRKYQPQSNRRPHRPLNPNIHRKRQAPATKSAGTTGYPQVR